MRAQPPSDITPTVLETKLYVPRPRPGQIARTRLVTRLDRGADAKLVIVSAPAGFGKTSLLTEWLSTLADEGGRRAAWLALDAGDNDPAHFWTYVIAGLRTLAPTMGETALELLRTPQALPVEAVLTTLINELGAIDGDVFLVLDDYHVIESREVHEALAYLLDHLPTSLHLVIASRADPPLPLARLRARNELVEVRAADLRFTRDEASAYLNDSMGLGLAGADVAALEGRTEGWIAALQLAALSMQGRSDATEFIAGFAGDDRFVVDYLVEEVVQRQPPEVQEFLLHTAVLTRLSGPLCDAVTGRAGGRAMLESLDRSNLFVVPLDDRRRWYRYHHLFADVLQARLLDEQPAIVPDLHRRASEWYADNGEPVEAINHAMIGGDAERAADLVETSYAVTRRDRQEGLLRSWLEALPTEVIRARPVLCNAFAGARLATADVEGVDQWLSRAERWLDAMSATPGERPQGMVVSNEKELEWLPTWVAIHRAGQSLGLGDVEATARHARRALDLRDEDDLLALGAGTALVGLASWPGGDLETTHAAYVACLTTFEQAGHVADVLGIAITVADIRLTWGRLGDAMRTYEDALRLATSATGSLPRGTADMYVGMSAVHDARGDLESVREVLRLAGELGERNGLPQNPYRWRVALARLRAAEGDLDAALDLLDEADRTYVGDFSPRVRPIPALKARIRIRQGRLGDALEWARREGLSAQDELSYLREFEHVTLARALLAQADDGLDPAVQLLARLHDAADAGGRVATAIEVLVLQSVAEHQRGDVPAALAALDRALVLAEPEGHVRVFVDEGRPMLELLRAAGASSAAPDLVRRLLAALGEEAETPSTRAVSGALVEPLSEREHEILRLLATDLSGPEIARRLVVSLNTVRTHTKNVYAKLGVNSRRAAVRRAEELGL